MEINVIKFSQPAIVEDQELKFDTSFDKFQVEPVELEEKITIVYEISK